MCQILAMRCCGKCRSLEPAQMLPNFHGVVKARLSSSDRLSRSAQPFQAIPPHHEAPGARLVRMPNVYSESLHCAVAALRKLEHKSRYQNRTFEPCQHAGSLKTGCVDSVHGECTVNVLRELPKNGHPWPSRSVAAYISRDPGPCPCCSPAGALSTTSHPTSALSLFNFSFWLALSSIAYGDHFMIKTSILGCMFRSIPF